MSVDKLKAVHEALSEIFSDSPLVSTRTEPSGPVFDNKALSEIFSEPHLSSTNTGEPSPIFDHAALANRFRFRPIPDHHQGSIVKHLRRHSANFLRFRPVQHYRHLVSIIKHRRRYRGNCTRFRTIQNCRLSTPIRGVHPRHSPVNSKLRSRLRKPSRLPFQPTKVSGRCGQSRCWPSYITYF
jgi:hypothetical protein